MRKGIDRYVEVQRVTTNEMNASPRWRSYTNQASGGTS